MHLKKLKYDLTVCKLKNFESFDMNSEFYFTARTDDEFSLVCKTKDTPENTLEREDGWKGFYICGVLDFSLIGILSKITAVLAENNIGVFAVSTYNTDYILVKAENFLKAENALKNAGHDVE